jgi:hypothetical protein
VPKRPIGLSQPTDSKSSSNSSKQTLPQPSRIQATGSPRVLDFDLETRRLGFHDGGRFSPTGCEPVIIAASWERGVQADFYSLNPTWDERDAREMLEWFASLWDEADIVTGHYIRKFDIPIVNGCLFEWGYPPLKPKRTLDTHGDMPRLAGMSKSQENLGEMLRIGSKKFHMNDTLWREVSRLTPRGLEEARARVVADVAQHQELRERLSGDWLKSGRWWAP